MGSLHNDLATWAGKAEAKGFSTIEITTETAMKISDLIIQLSTKVDELQDQVKASERERRA